MLADFQQAFADLVGSPGLCRTLRLHPEMLRERYKLSPLEYERLVGIVNHAGMTCNCILYRANRLAPIALNLRELSRGLGDDLKPLLDEFWERYPNTNVNFLMECDRFAKFLLEKEAQGYEMSQAAKQAFEREYEDLQLRLEATLTVL